MSRSVLSSLKHKAQPSVLGLDKTQIVNLLNILKTILYMHLFILTLKVSIWVVLALKIGWKI